MRRHLAPFYSSTGRRSVDRELIIGMLIVGYTLGIRSERRLCEECVNASRFLSMVDARKRITDWRFDYNEERPHSALGN